MSRLFWQRFLSPDSFVAYTALTELHTTDFNTAVNAGHQLVNAGVRDFNDTTAAGGAPTTPGMHAPQQQASQSGSVSNKPN